MGLLRALSEIAPIGGPIDRPGDGYPRSAPCTDRPDGKCDGPVGGCRFAGCWKKPPGAAGEPSGLTADGHESVGDRFGAMRRIGVWLAALGVFFVAILIVAAAQRLTRIDLPKCKDVPEWNSGAPCRR